MQILLLLYMYPICLAANLLNLVICLNLVLLYYDSLSLFINVLHCFSTSLSWIKFLSLV